MWSRSAFLYYMPIILSQVRNRLFKCNISDSSSQIPLPFPNCLPPLFLPVSFSFSLHVQLPLPFPLLAPLLALPLAPSPFPPPVSNAFYKRGQIKTYLAIISERGPPIQPTPWISMSGLGAFSHTPPSQKYPVYSREGREEGKEREGREGGERGKEKDGSEGRGNNEGEEEGRKR